MASEDSILNAATQNTINSSILETPASELDIHKQPSAESVITAKNFDPEIGLVAESLPESAATAAPIIAISPEIPLAAVPIENASSVNAVPAASITKAAQPQRISAVLAVASRQQKENILAGIFHFIMSAIIFLERTVFETIFHLKRKAIAAPLEQELADSLLEAAKDSTIPAIESQLDVDDSFDKTQAELLLEGSQLIGQSAEKLAEGYSFNAVIDDAEASLKQIARTLDYLYYNGGQKHQIPDLSADRLTIDIAESVAAADIVVQSSAATVAAIPVVPNVEAKVATAVSTGVLAGTELAVVQVRESILKKLAEFIEANPDQPIAALPPAPIETQKAESVPIETQSAESVPVETVAAAMKNAKPWTFQERFNNFAKSVFNGASVIAQNVSKEVAYVWRAAVVPAFRFLTNLVADFIDAAMHKVRPLQVDEIADGKKKDYVKPIHEVRISAAGFRHQQLDIAVKGFKKLVANETPLGYTGIADELNDVVKYDGCEEEQLENENYVKQEIDILHQNQKKWNCRAVAVMQLLDDEHIYHDKIGVATLIHNSMIAHKLSEQDAYQTVEAAIQKKIECNAPGEALVRLTHCFDNPPAQLESAEFLKAIVNDYSIVAGKACYISRETWLDECKQISSEIGIPGVQQGMPVAKMLPFIKEAIIAAAIKVGLALPQTIPESSTFKDKAADDADNQFESDITH